MQTLGRLRLWMRQRAPRRRITRGGWVFLGGTVAVGTAALLTANNLLFLILATMLAMLLVSNFLGRLSLAGLELDFLLPEHIAARQKVAARVWVRNSKRLVPAFSVHLTGVAGSVLSPLYFPLLPGGAVLEETVEVTFPQRGPHGENAFRFSTLFPFGFLERRADVALRRQALVYPSIQPQAGFEELLASIRGDIEVYQRGRGHDFYRIRPYEALESARHVDWKATAHTGSLQVREFVREEERQLELFLDLDVPAGAEGWFEQAVDCCAFLAWRVAERGQRLRLRSQEFDLAMPAMGDVYDVLKLLALVACAPGKPPLVPSERESYQVVLSTRDPRLLAEAGWSEARILGPGSGGLAAAQEPETR
jgi:uncharacterized protein (DUF58 family)